MHYSLVFFSDSDTIEGMEREWFPLLINQNPHWGKGIPT